MADHDSPAGVVSRTPVDDRRHPLHVFAGRLTAAVDELAGASTLAMGVAETVETTVELTTASSQLRAVQLAVLAHADVLDLGRRARTATRGQRLALAVQQAGTCGIEHCDRPTTWADAHHWRQRWTDGGRTDLADLVLLCTRHHSLCHLPGRTLTRRPRGPLPDPEDVNHPATRSWRAARPGGLGGSTEAARGRPGLGRSRRSRPHNASVSVLPAARPCRHDASKS